MEITYLGANCLRLTTKDIAVIIDPQSAGTAAAKLSADVTLLTQIWEAGNLPAKAGMVIDGAGEYEVKRAMITGVPARLHSDEPEAHLKSTVYSVLLDGVRVGVVGNIAELTDAAADSLGPIDVLIVPVGGNGLTLDAVEATKLVSKLEPRYVIPVHYADKGLSYPMPQDELELFLKEVGSHPEPVPKLRVTARDLPEEATVVVLQRG